MTVLSRRAVHILGALMVALQPRMAQDAKLDLTPVLKGVTAKNFKDRKVGILTGLKDATKNKLAKDANLDDVTQLLDALEQCDVAEGVDADPTTGEPMEALPKPVAADAGMPAALLTFLKGKLSDADMAEAQKLCSATPPAEKDPEKKENDMKDAITKPAMDAAITTAVDAATKKATADALAQGKAIREAEKAVRPYVGELAIAQDSADAVYRTALTMLGVKVDGVHPSAFPALLAAQPAPGAKRRAEPLLAQDAGGSKAFLERFPDAGRIGGMQ